MSATVTTIIVVDTCCALDMISKENVNILLMQEYNFNIPNEFIETNMST